MLTLKRGYVPEKLLIYEALDEPDKLLSADLSEFSIYNTELLPLELIYYERSNIKLNSYNGKPPLASKTWWELEENDNIKLNSCYISFKYAFAGRAVYEIEKFSRSNPELFKLLNITPLWNVKMDLGYRDETVNGYENVLMIDEIFSDYNSVADFLEYLEILLPKINWLNESRYLFATKDVWSKLSMHEQRKYKLEYFDIKMPDL